MSSNIERSLEKRRQAWADYDARVAFDAHWAGEAARIQAAKKAERDTEAAGRRELVAHLMQPGAIAECLMARAKFSAPVIAADRKLPSTFCWMPKGCHEISAGLASGGTFQGQVICNEAGANAVIASFAKLTLEGQRIFIDLQHRRGEAAAWVGGFSWDPGAGIQCSVSWTSLGETSIRDRIFSSFSPTFLIDQNGRVAGLAAGEPAGALTNTPAFGLAMPLISASGRIGMADAVHETLVTSGISAAAADVVATAIRSGHDGQAIVALLRAISS